jgi:hypothetical protein
VINNFVKFGGVNVTYHNYHMPKDVLFIGITSTLIKGVFLRCLKLLHDPRFRIVDDVVDYIIM